MSVIGTLAVNIVARTQKFVQGTDKARTGLKGLKSDAKGMVGTLNSLQGAFVAAAGFGGILRFVQSEFQAIDALAKTSKMLGIQTDAFQALDLAASQTGVQTEQLSKGLQFLSRQIGDVTTGTAMEAEKAFRKLGLDAQELAAKPLQQAVGEIADQINMLPTQAEKTAIAVDLFGRSAVPLLNTLALGSRGLGKFSEELERIGGAISSEEAANIERANDALDKLSRIATGIGRSFIADFAPGFAAFLEDIVEAVKLINEFVDKIPLMDKLKPFLFTFEGFRRAEEKEKKLLPPAELIPFEPGTFEGPEISPEERLKRQKAAESFFRQREAQIKAERQRRAEIRQIAFERGEARRMRLMRERQMRGPGINRLLLPSAQRELESQLAAQFGGQGDLQKVNEKQLSTQEQIRDALAGAPRIEITEGAGL